MDPNRFLMLGFNVSDMLYVHLDLSSPRPSLFYSYMPTRMFSSTLTTLSLSTTLYGSFKHNHYTYHLNSLKDLCPFHYFLGVQVSYCGSNALLSPNLYIIKTIQKVLFNAKPLSSLMASCPPPSKE